MLQYAAILLISAVTSFNLFATSFNFTILWQIKDVNKYIAYFCHCDVHK